jgi:MGT family glycosyltransferase
VACDYATEHGITVDWNEPSGTLSKRLWLAQLPKELDFAATPWPQQFRYAGPFHDGERRASVAFPWERLTGERIIYASLGTLQNGLEEIFSTIAEGVGDRAGVQLVLSVGPFLDVEKITSLPQNAIVVQQAPQLELLKQATLCITHAGLNTALECLAEGVPMVAIPITNDQPGVAARITAAGAGTTVPLHMLTAKLLRTHIDEVLDQPAFRQNAQRFMGIIAATDGLNKAADLLEEAFGLKAIAVSGTQAA